MNKIFFLSLLVILISCEKETPNNTVVDLAKYTKEISTNIHFQIYNEFVAAADSLNQHINVFQIAPSELELNACKFWWKTARSAWEKSEGFLFGPVATDNIDPQIDSWPIDFQAIEIELSGNSNLGDPTVIQELDETLRGFHPIEYLLWGSDGNKSFANFTNRELLYLIGLSFDLLEKSKYIKSSWEPTINSFYSYFTAPTSNNPYYNSYFDVINEQLNGLIGICDELANTKIGEPLLFQDPSLEESPFADNSLQDFKDNLKSVQAIYYGDYLTNGLGISDLIRAHSLALDQEIKIAIALAKEKLDAVSAPFGEAITLQTTELIAAQTAISDLTNLLESKGLPFFEKYYAQY